MKETFVFMCHMLHGIQHTRLLHTSPQRGFTLVEVVVTFFILVMASGVLIALFHPIIFAPDATLRLEALYLAQEGVEIVRNIRDTNFAEIAEAQSVNWLDGLMNCDMGCEGDYLSDALVPTLDRTLFRNSDGFYDYDPSGDPKLFRRTIIVDPDPVIANKAAVSVEVSWDRKGQTHSVEVSTEIYNWLEE